VAGGRAPRDGGRRTRVPRIELGRRRWRPPRKGALSSLFPPRGTGRVVRPARDAQHGKTAARIARRHRLRRPDPRVLRGRRRQARGRNDPRPRPPVRLHAPGAPRGHGAHRPLELPAPPLRAVRGSGARGRQRRRPETGEPHTAHRGRLRAAREGGGDSRRDPQRCHRERRRGRRGADRGPAVCLRDVHGSGDVGRRIAELAARRFVPLTLELGGKGPVLVFPDADLERAAKAVGYGIFGNAGQMCWAASRLLIHESIRAPFLEKLRGIAEGLKLGPGVLEGVEMGPLVSKEQVERVLDYVRDARESGGTVVAGGSKADDPVLAAGNFVRPTILADVPPNSRAVREEIFGPVLAVASFSDTEEAVRMANDTPYGLLAALWTRDLSTAHSVARRLESGMVVVNDSPTTYPQTPFGGVKSSGVGFEQGLRALDTFTRRKNVLVNVG